jgi:hypothetical protein
MAQNVKIIRFTDDQGIDKIEFITPTENGIITVEEFEGLIFEFEKTK